MILRENASRLSMDNKELFQKNLQRWSLFSPDYKETLSQFQCANIQFSKNSNGDFNLVQKINNQNVFFHSLESVQNEARDWFNSLDLRYVSVLYVFGIGLGYAYTAAKQWLKEDCSRSLIFLEDNLEVIHRFLETGYATEVLNDNQVWLEYFSWDGSLDTRIKKITSPFSLQRFTVASQPFYISFFPENLKVLHSKISFWSNFSKAVKNEIFSCGVPFFNNLYRNLYQLPNCYQGNHLFGKFKNIPAIVCGAGPSLEKNLHILETLSDRAIIFAGATALNAVNARGFLPHFGVGIDPNPAQKTRLIANKAYQVPFLFRSRMNYKAVEAIHGDLQYITGSGYGLTDWIEKELGIAGENIDEGFNVVNFSLSLASAMGCFPIILVGVDLAYTEMKSYYSGVISHPTDDFKKDFTTKSSEEELLEINDIYGKPVLTQWKWLAESSWYTRIAQSNSDKLIINATEGGIGMKGIPNKPLSEVADYLLNRQFDLLTRIHGEIQNSQNPSLIQDEKIEQLIKELKDSLDRCLWIYTEMQEKIIEELNSDFDDSSFLSKLKVEVAYQNILNSFDTFFQEMIDEQLKKIEHDIFDLQGKKKKRNELVAKKYVFLKNTASINSTLIQMVLKERKEIKLGTTPQSAEIYKSAIIGNEEYSFVDGNLSISDPELEIFIKDTCCHYPFIEGNGKDVLLYPSGNIKLEQYFKNCLLNGPVTFYSDEGNILARSWFLKGKRQGKSLFYYLSGKTHSILRYKDGLLNGVQEYFYPNGILKSRLGFIQGQLDGEVHLYYPNGDRKRELHFSSGLRHGVEKMWNASGLQILQVQYRNDKPIGLAKTWYDDGQQFQEILFDEDGKKKSIQKWDQNGLLIEEKDTGQDFFDQVAVQANLLSDSLLNVYDELAKIVPMVKNEVLKEELPYKLENDFTILKESLDKLHSLGKDLLHESGIQSEDTIETIWKTPSSQMELEKKLETMTDTLKRGLDKIQEMIGGIKPPPPIPPSEK